MFIVTILSTGGGGGGEQKQNQKQNKDGSYNDCLPSRSSQSNRGLKHKDTF